YFFEEVEFCTSASGRISLKFLVKCLCLLEHKLVDFPVKFGEEFVVRRIENYRAGNRLSKGRIRFHRLNPRDHCGCLGSDQQCKFALGETPAATKWSYI